MKKSIALILSIILLVTIGMPTFAIIIADPSLVLPENHWYLDSGIQYSHDIEMSTYQPGNRDEYYLDDLYTFHSTKEFEDFKITGQNPEAFKTNEEEWTIIQEKGDWQVTIQLFRRSPKGGFSKEEPGTVYEATGEILFKDGSKYTFPMVMTITDDVIAKFTAESGHAALLHKSQDKDDGNDVGIQLLGWGESTEGLSARWIVEDKASKPHAGFSPPEEANKLLELTSTDFKLENGIPTNRVKLYGYRPGFFNLDCTVFYNEEAISNDGNIEAEVVGFEAVEDDTLNEAKTELGKGNPVTIQVPEDKGLSFAQLKGLKDAANGADPKITLKPENDEGLGLEMSFSASDIAADTTDKVFTPSFTPKIPPEAEENGFSDAADTVTWIRFDYDGVPPAPMTIRMRAPAGISDGTLVKIWRYNEQTQKLEVQTTVECENGFITFTLDHFSTYAIYPASVDPNPSSDYTPSIKPSQSSGGSGGGGGSSSHSSSAVSKGILNGSALSVKTTASAKSVSIADATNAANKAIAQAKADGKSTASVQFVNAASLSKATLDAVQKAGNQKGIKVAVCADTVTNGTVTARLYIDPTAATLDNEIGTAVQLDNPVIDQHFMKYFKNNLKAIKFMHQGSFGMELGVAIKLDLQKIDASKIVLYSYDVASNSYQKLPNQTFFIDKNGYLHFYVTSGGYVVISEGTL